MKDDVVEQFEVEMTMESKTAGGQGKYFCSPAVKDTAGARNLYVTKNAFQSPTAAGAKIRVTVELLK